MSLSRQLQRIQAVRGAYVDRNFGLGWAVVEQQLTILEKISDDPERVGRKIAQSKRWLTELEALANPHSLPSDYREFLENCGGLAISSPAESVTLAVFGVGPGADYWYSPVVDVNTDIRRAPGLLLIASWHWSAPPVGNLDIVPEAIGQDGRLLTPFDEDYPGPARERLERFWLNVSNDIHYGNVLLEQSVSSANSDWNFHRVAASFTEWLDVIASTEGQLGQLVPPVV